MTKQELKDTLQTDLIPYLKEAVVSINFLNRHITLLGAAGAQVVPMVSDNMTILDALAGSANLGEKGKIDKILVIREKGNDKEFKRLNLADNSIFYSPYFFLQQNDIIYVEPKKVNVTQTTKIISYVTTAISFFLLLSRVFNF